MTATQARAVRFDQYGGRDVLYVADIDVPAPGAGEVLVEVRAAGINPGEAAIRSGAMREQFPATFPSGEGSDLAGVVVEVGDGVSDFAVGDEVLGFSFPAFQPRHAYRRPGRPVDPQTGSAELGGRRFAVRRREPRHTPR